MYYAPLIIKYKRYKRNFIYSLTLLFLIWYINCLPEKLFNAPTSTVLLDKDGILLGAKIAGDGQWRFSSCDSVPKKFETCIIQFEDRDFYSHLGFSLKGIGRAITQNIKKKKVVSGGSTLTMQLSRLTRKNPPRTVAEKLIELLMATRLEIKYSKKEILNYYASNAPFGNNVVGLEAASWRYFGRSSHKLSWAESATLAVLPNAPGLIYPGKNHDRLLKKRNRLLTRLHEIKVIDDETYHLSLQEPLPEKPLQLPQLAPHLLMYAIKNGQKGKTIHSTIDFNLQQQSIAILNTQNENLLENKIYNGAILITSVKSGRVLAYVGNTNLKEIEYSCNVDCIRASRSSGSVLKPLLFERALENGDITPNMLLHDIPTQYGGFSPKNFSQQYDGAVPASKALARSLNIPMVRLLNDYGLEKFHTDLKNFGFTTLNHSAKHYGLSLILGGAETKLWDINKVYTQMAQRLKLDSTKEITYVKTKKEKSEKEFIDKLDEACIYKTFEAMVDVNRPDEDGNWRAFHSSQKIAWKTGTSFGFRDAWAVGITPDYVVSVWIGNADGEGRPGLTGIKAAAPILFEVFNQLPKSNVWFKEPKTKMTKMKICRESGHRANLNCDLVDTLLLPNTCQESVSCPYHQIIHLSKSENKRVDSECENVYNMKHETFFILPPIIEKYYKFNHPNYKMLPEFKPECLTKMADKAMGILYPKPNHKVYIPIELDGNKGKVVFEATHRNSSTKIYWHIDNEYLGETKDIHQFTCCPSPGKHTLLLVDENGIRISVKFTIVGK